MPAELTSRESIAEIASRFKHLGRFYFADLVMKASCLLFVGVFFAILSACAALDPPVHSGEREDIVIAKLGQPTHRYQDGQDRLLVYATGPWGQQTHMARIGPSGKLISYEQVLTTQKFASIRIGSTKQEVLRIVGAPGETTYLPLPRLEVWSYSYREANAWDSIMHIHFDESGAVRRLENGPDPKRDPERRHRIFGW
ncbi:MAG TPA: hypothetical protein VEC06_05760 [Paucimonas sp.]|nr:hypothetical protein [Paucimonas sp.]